MTEKLWAIRIPAPDEIFAAPSHKVALLMKEWSDKCNKEWLAAESAKGCTVYLSLDDCLAVVEEIEDPEEHAELLLEFKFSDWDITEEDMNKQEEVSPQIGLFAGEVES